MRQIFLIMSIGVLLYGAFNRDETGVVVDKLTGLVWQDDYSDNGNKIKQSSWQDALIYCQELRLASSLDWRLPNIIELKSIRKTSNVRPAIDKVFKNTVGTYYWSSTTPIRNTSNAWRIDFYDGLSSETSKTDINYIRCVRGGE